MASISQVVSIQPPLGGQRRDLSRLSIPSNAAYFLNNVVGREGKVIVRPGFVPFGSSASTYVNGLVSYKHHSGVQMSVRSTLTRWYKWNPSTYDWVDISPAANLLSANEGDPQVFRTFWKSSKTYLLGVNGHNDNPICWDGVTAEYADIGGTPPKAKAMAVLSNRCVLGNLPAAPYQIDVSSFNDFEAGWGSTQVVNLMDTPGDIVAIVELGNLTGVVYKEDAIHLMIAQAALAPFRFELKQAGIKGPITSRSIVNTPAGHYFLNSHGDIMLFDGFSLSSVNPSIKSHLDLTIDKSENKLKKAFGFYNGFHREVWFCYCGVDSSYPNLGLVISLDTQAVWPVSFPAFYPTAAAVNELASGTTIGGLGSTTIGSMSWTIGSMTASQSALSLAASSGQVYSDTGTLDGSTAIPFLLETGLMFPNVDAYVAIHETDHLFNKTAASQQISVELGLSNSGEDLTYTSPRTIDISSTGPHVLGHRSSARLVAMKLTGNANQYVEFKGSMVSGVGRGQR